MSEGIGPIKGQISSSSDSGGFDSIVQELSDLIGKTGNSITIDMESGSSCSNSTRAENIFRRIDTLR